MKLHANPLIAQLTHQPFPEVAEILRNAAEQITLAWDQAVRMAMPQMQHLTYDELKDSTPQILLAIASALASDDPDVIRELIGHAPSQGLSRFRLHFDVVEIMQEDRLLRGIIVQHVETQMGRRMQVLEAAAMHTTIDIMLQQSVIAMVDQQKSQLRTAAEIEMKFLSFLSHDLNNNLNSIMMTLHEHGIDLKQAGNFPDAEASLGAAEQCIQDTVTGMRRMMDHARLENPNKKMMVSAFDLYSLAEKVQKQFEREAKSKGVELVLEIALGTMVESDPDLTFLVLQNLVGNGVKYCSSGGAVCIGFRDKHDSDPPEFWVSDNGPGIAPDKMKDIFDAFKRGEIHGQQGVGLGLAIASQAAMLLGAELTVESTLGAGSIFRMTLPASDKHLIEQAGHTAVFAT